MPLGGRVRGGQSSYSYGAVTTLSSDTDCCCRQGNGADRRYCKRDGGGTPPVWQYDTASATVFFEYTLHPKRLALPIQLLTVLVSCGAGTRTALGSGIRRGMMTR